VDDALENGLSTVATFVPKLILFLVILVIGIIVAKLLSKAVNAVLERVGFDRAIERGGVAKAMENSKYDPSDILAKVVYYAVLLFTLQLAFSAFGPNAISDLLTGIIAFLPKAFVAIVIVVIAAAIAAGVKSLIEGALGGLSYGKVLANIAAVFILGLGIIAALNQVGIATTVTMPVLIAVLGTIAGILVVGVGGGLIKPMQSRWEQYLTRAEAEAPRIRAQASSSPSVAEQARSAKDQFQQQQPQQGRGSTATTGATSAGQSAVYDQTTVRSTSYDGDPRV
jgi:Conserved TM helix